ncbi:helix-turn-helix transcriptional regulator [Nocardiopsis gilva]|uniref:helix-turn-helix domain-containing protein n=1 Tax=Nocardiopsis gilva TaxID=280236 RepID=UPI00036B1BC7|nr:helix-turn-helix transcriptional regulator [Nocardiopsis gilva]
MATKYVPTVGKRRLSRELRRLRNDRGLTLKDVAKRLDCSHGKVANLETGNWMRISLTDIRAMLDLYEVTDPKRREAIETLVRQARERGWWEKYSPHLPAAYVGFENEACRISTFQCDVVPGLLQTADYTRALVGRQLGDDPAEVERLVESRQRRHQIFERSNPPKLWAILDESALLHIPDRSVFRDQVQHLVSLATGVKTITIQLVPIAAGLHNGLGQKFVILDYEDELDLSVVYLELYGQALYIEDKPRVTGYRDLFNLIQLDALHPHETVPYLRAMLDQSD